MRNYIGGRGIYENGFVPASFSDKMSSDKVDKIMRRSEVVLRFSVMIMGLVSAVTVALASQNEVVMGIHKTADFLLMKSLLCFVIIGGILAGYSLAQGLRCVWDMYRGSVRLSKPLAWIIFSCDQVMTYVSLAAAATAAESAYLAENGLSELQWIKLCGYFGRFCMQTGGGIVIGFVAAVFMVALSGMSAFNLFRLYGSKARRI